MQMYKIMTSKHFEKNGSCLCLLISVVYCVLVKACVLLLNSLNSMILLYP